MDISTIISVIVPIIEQLPTVEQGVAALVNAIKAMIAKHPNANEVIATVEQMLPQLTSAIVANTAAAGHGMSN
jgi:hypothetical protein